MAWLDLVSMTKKPERPEAAPSDLLRRGKKKKRNGKKREKEGSGEPWALSHGWIGPRPFQTQFKLREATIAEWGKLTNGSPWWE